MRKLMTLGLVLALSIGINAAESPVADAARLRAEGAMAWLAEAISDAPIAEAAAKGDRETVKSLLKQAADVNAAMTRGCPCWLAR